MLTEPILHAAGNLTVSYTKLRVDGDILEVNAELRLKRGYCVEINRLKARRIDQVLSKEASALLAFQIANHLIVRNSKLSHSLKILKLQITL